MPRKPATNALLTLSLVLLSGIVLVLLLPVAQVPIRALLPATVHDGEKSVEGDYLLGVGKADITGCVMARPLMMSIC